MTWLSATLDPDTVLHRLLTTVTRARGDEHAWLLTGTPPTSTVTIVDGDSGTQTLAAHAHPDLAGLLELDQPTVYDEQPPWRRILADPTDQPACWLAVPLIARDERLGVLVLASTRPHAYTDADIGITAALASQGMVAYDNARLFTQVHHLATIDGLTGIANRRHFFETAQREVAMARRRQTSLAAVMLDIDHFKHINDTHGHQIGDDVIRAVVERLRRHSRDTDILARYGGEEFVLLLPDAGTHALDTAERLREEVARTPVQTRTGPVDVTISVGAAYLSPSDTGLDTLLARADECLYSAKQNGRNRVVIRD
jgi:diguanylate cyclase (GGDEF)-like protein